VHPPVATDFFTPDGRASSSEFLVVSALVPYKRIDVAIESCRRLRVPLTVVGTGPERERLEAAAGPDVRFLGWQSDDQIRALYRRSAAVILPGVEDFGIVPIEAQACGCPVVALDAGGARETVVDGVTGVLVPESTPEAFADALASMGRRRFAPDTLREHARQFSKERFLAGFSEAVAEAVRAKREQRTTD
jgi:glycosyltransferase involved in cell wall biosynthesis